MSDIDWSRIRSITAREIVSVLQNDGFVFVRQKGSHHRFKHPDGRRATVAFSNGSDTFVFKTIKSIILKQAKWSDKDLKRLGLL